MEKEPKPLGLFTEFGDSTLTFELRFRANVTQANAALVSSDLRLRTAGSFAEHGIVIAFPQRDIHLDTKSPLRVEVVPAADHQAGNVRNPSQTEVGDKPGELP